LPSTTELLWVTTASAPRAVALVIPFAPLEDEPINVLWDSTEFDRPERLPKKALSVPVLLLRPAKNPTAAVWGTRGFFLGGKASEKRILEARGICQAGIFSEEGVVFALGVVQTCGGSEEG